jgi:hypothetical protein
MAALARKMINISHSCVIFNTESVCPKDFEVLYHGRSCILRYYASSNYFEVLGLSQPDFLEIELFFNLFKIQLKQQEVISK